MSEKRAVAPLGKSGIVIASILAAVGAWFVYSYFHGGSSGDLGAGCVFLGCALVILLIRVVTRLTTEEVLVNIPPFPAIRVPYGDIESATVHSRGRGWRGLGYRIIGPGIRAMLSGGPEVSLTYGNGKELMFSHPDPDSFVADVKNGMARTK